MILNTVFVNPTFYIVDFLCSIFVAKIDQKHI